MTVQDELREALGVNQKELTVKSAGFTKFLIDRLINETNSTQEDMLKHLFDNFTAGELAYYAIIYMCEKTDGILEEMAEDDNPQIKSIGLLARIKKAAAMSNPNNNNNNN